MNQPNTELQQWQIDQPAVALIANQVISIGEKSAATAVLVAERSLTPSLQCRVWQNATLDTDQQAPEGAEWFLLPAGLPTLAKPGLLLMDMDSTAIQIECIDEIARRGGVYQQVAQVTEQAMQGQLDFTQALQQRVAMLKGIDASVLTEIAAELPLMPGLTTLCRQLQQHGWRVAIASGGFNAIASVLAAQLQLDHFEANELEVVDGKLSGRVIGPVVDAKRKAQILTELGQRYCIEPSQWVAVGDGANDLPMLAVANLGVGFHAKPKVAAQADVAIERLGLDAILGMLRP